MTLCRNGFWVFINFIYSLFVVNKASLDRRPLNKDHWLHDSTRALSGSVTLFMLPTTHLSPALFLHCSDCTAFVDFRILFTLEEAT